MTEKERRDSGLWYDANNDPELQAEFARGRDLAFELNQVRPSDARRREELVRRLFGHVGASPEVISPVYTDLGYRVSLGDRVFVNCGAYLMDGAPITIGNDVFIGPNCGMYTAAHPLVASERNRGLERARPITIGDDVWIGGDVTILGGVTIGAGSVIGAKSLVTRDIPAGVIAVGNPCRVVRPITDADRIEMRHRM